MDSYSSNDRSVRVGDAPESPATPLSETLSAIHKRLDDALSQTNAIIDWVRGPQAEDGAKASPLPSGIVSSAQAVETKVASLQYNIDRIARALY